MFAGAITKARTRTVGACEAKSRIRKTFCRAGVFPTLSIIFGTFPARVMTHPKVGQSVLCQVAKLLCPPEVFIVVNTANKVALP
eukprot:312322-Pyramimonas_sp.AAC.3